VSLCVCVCVCVCACACACVPGVFTFLCGAFSFVSIQNGFKKKIRGVKNAFVVTRSITPYVLHRCSWLAQLPRSLKAERRVRVLAAVLWLVPVSIMRVRVQTAKCRIAVLLLVVLVAVMRHADGLAHAGKERKAQYGGEKNEKGSGHVCIGNHEHGLARHVEHVTAVVAVIAVVAVLAMQRARGGKGERVGVNHLFFLNVRA